jgi:4-phytase/acid phosphatase
LLPLQGCPQNGDIFIWSDSADQRTRASGDALIAGLSPACGATAHHAPIGSRDPLFGSDGRCKSDPEQAKAAVLARAGGSIDALGTAYDKARRQLHRILFPNVDQSACTASENGKCYIVSGHNTFRLAKDSIRLDGPLAVGSSLSESILLEFSEGLAPDNIGWGRAANADAVAAIMPLHDIYADLTRRNPYFASRHGAILAKQIADVIEEGAHQRLPGEASIPSSAKIVALVGHDTNLSNISGLLDTDWVLPGQPDKTAPGTTLAFEIWRRVQDNERFVRLVVHYQTLAQLRGDDQKQAESVRVRFQHCVESFDESCRSSNITEHLRKSIEPSCLN